MPRQQREYSLIPSPQGERRALKEGSNYCCTVCKGQTGSTEGVKGPELLLGGEGGCGFECVTEFCYLGDMIGAGGGAGDASRTRVRCAWGKFNELQPVLAERGTSLKLKEKFTRPVYRVFWYMEVKLGP